MRACNELPLRAGLLADQVELFAQPRFEISDDRAAIFLTRSAMLVGRSATDVILNLVEFGDPSQRLAGNRRRTGCCQLMKAPTDMHPAEGERAAAFVGQHAIATIAVDLQDSSEACEVSDLTLGLSIRRITVRKRGGLRPTSLSSRTSTWPISAPRSPSASAKRKRSDPSYKGFPSFANDLSRGCNANGAFHMIAVTVVQAGGISQRRPGGQGKTSNHRAWRYRSAKARWHPSGSARSAR